MISCDMSTDSLGFQIVKDVLIDLSENTSNIRSTSRKNLRGELSDDKMRSGGPKLLCLLWILYEFLMDYAWVV